MHLQAANALLRATGVDSISEGAAEGQNPLQTDGMKPLEALSICDDSASQWGGHKGRRRGRKVNGFFPATVLDGSDSVTGGTASGCKYAQSLPQRRVAGSSQQSQPRDFALRITPHKGKIQLRETALYYNHAICCIAQFSSFEPCW